MHCAAECKEPQTLKPALALPGHDRDFLDSAREWSLLLRDGAHRTLIRSHLCEVGVKHLLPENVLVVSDACLCNVHRKAQSAHCLAGLHTNKPLSNLQCQLEPSHV